MYLYLWFGSKCYQIKVSRFSVFLSGSVFFSCTGEHYLIDPEIGFTWHLSDTDYFYPTFPNLEDYRYGSSC